MISSTKPDSNGAYKTLTVCTATSGGTWTWLFWHVPGRCSFLMDFKRTHSANSPTCRRNKHII